jgi:hypothetical protein
MRTPLRPILPSPKRSTSTAFDIVRELKLAFPRAKETRYYKLPALEVDGEVFVVQTSHRSAESELALCGDWIPTSREAHHQQPARLLLKPHYQNLRTS